MAMGLVLAACGGGGSDGDGAGNGNPGGSNGGDTTLIDLSGLSGAEDSITPRSFTVPAGTTRLVVRTRVGSGDVDMLVTGPGATPCTSTAGNNEETCEFTSPAAGSWEVLLRGFEAYSGVTLTVTATMGSSSGGDDGDDNEPAPSGITQLSATAYLPGGYVEAGGRVFFVSREDPPFLPRLWMTDGTPGGTRSS